MVRTFPLSGKLLPWAILLFLSVIWGLSFLFIKKIVVVLSPIELGAARVFLAGVFLLPWAFRGLKIIPKSKLKWLFLAGLFGNLIPAFIYALVGKNLNSSLAGTLNATTPIFVMLIGALFFATRIKKFQTIGIITAFCGSLLLVLSGNDGRIDYANPYALLAMSATLMYGLNVNIVGTYLKGLNPLLFTATAFLFVGFMAFCILPFTDFFPKMMAKENQSTLIYMLFLAGINTSMALVIFNYLIQITSAVFASTVTYLMPIVAIVAGFLDGEIISIWHYLGMIIILSGVYLINRK